MILPNVRATFGAREVDFLLDLLAGDDARARRRIESRLGEEGLDALLDDPATLNAVLTGGGLSPAPGALVCYLLVRHALLEHGVTEPVVADYLAALMDGYGRPHGTGASQGQYLVDILAELAQASGDHAFMLQVRLGDLSLWMAGLFPERITARVHRRGAPGLDYYEEMGATGYRMASSHREAGSLGLDGLYRDCASSFQTLRVALNVVADRHLFPRRAPAIDRLLRQVSDGAS